MIRASHLTRGTFCRLLGASVILAYLACISSTALAASPAESVGLGHRYTYSSCSSTKPVDPINVVWESEDPNDLDNLATPDNVANRLENLGWDHDEYKSPWTKTFGLPHQYVHTNDNRCVRDGRQEATGCAICTRYHVRLFSTNAGGDFFVVGDAHHDKVVAGNGCGEGAKPGGHIADSFDSGRRELQEIWPGSRKIVKWGNTQAMQQCDGSWTNSDGNVLYLGQLFSVSGKHSASEPVNTVEPSISGTPLPGRVLTANPGTWLPNGSGPFVYQWCHVEISEDVCAPYAGATGSTWTPGPGDVGRYVSVMVKPAYAGTEYELSQAVEIHPTSPSVQTTDAEEIGINSALLVGWVNPNGSNTNFYFEIGTTTAYGATFPAAPGWGVGSGTSSVHVAASMSGLAAGTLYHYRIVASNSNGVRYGEDRVFATKGPPQVTTGPATGVTRQNALLTGTVTPGGLATNYYFQFGRTAEYDRTVPWWGPSGWNVGDGNTPVEISADPGILDLGTTYHYRIVASNAAGTSYGADRTFTTLTYPPGAATSPATQVNETWATLNGKVSSTADPTNYYFQYGPTTSYGSVSPPLPGGTYPANQFGDVYRDVYGLEPGTTYHYRLVATNRSGTDYGVDQTFVTPSPYTPRVETASSGEVTKSKITMTSKVDVRGLGGYYRFEYGSDDKYGSQTEEKFVPVGTGYQLVSQALEGLPVGWTIHYRVVATNEDRTVYGPDQVATTGWANEPITPPKSSKMDWLKDISCPSAGNCIAVGAYVNSTTGKKSVAAERWNGTSWTPLEMPVPPGTSSELLGVSCVSMTSCVAVGQVVPLNDFQPLAMKWDGTAWSEVSLGSLIPAGSQSQLSDISCPAANSCEAVGYSVASGVTKVLAMHWDGAAWSARPSNPSQEGALLQSVSCASTTVCKAVGKASGGSLIQRLNATEWVSEVADKGDVAGRGLTDGGLTGVSCPTTTACFAVGVAMRPDGLAASQSFIQHWNGSKWSYEWAPAASENTAPIGLGGISCSSSTSCRAVGQRGRGVLWTGREWKLQAIKPPVPLEPSLRAELFGISCPTKFECHAVGYYEKSSTRLSLTQGWSGTGAVPQTLGDSAASVTESTATLRAFVDPAGVDTNYYFQYGLTEAYGSKTPEVGAGSGGIGPTGGSWVGASADLTALQPGGNYHYRVVATNGTTTTYGPDTTFKTENKLNDMAMTEPFNGGGSAVSYFGLKWAPLQWTATRKGVANANGYGPSDTTANGAYFMPALYDWPVLGTSPVGLATEATVAAGPGVGGRFSLWLDMTAPATTKSGYELSMQETSANTYTATLKRWNSGVATTLATKTGYPLAAGDSLALVDRYGKVEVWGNQGNSFVQFLSAIDGYFAYGSAGLEVAGSTATRLTNFKFGTLLPKAASFDAAAKSISVADSLSREEAPLSLGGAWAPLSWATAAAKTGRVATLGWTPYEAALPVAGAYWQKAQLADTGYGDVAIATYNRLTSAPAYYFGLWLNATTPGSAKNGYQLRVAETSGNTVELKLVKWINGSSYTLATKTGLYFPGALAGTKFALADKAGTVSVWTSSGGGPFTQALSVSDVTYSYGYAGIEGVGSVGLGDFKLGQLPSY
jgi:hypothetical protein